MQKSLIFDKETSREDKIGFSKDLRHLYSSPKELNRPMRHATIEYVLKGQQVCLSPEKCLFWINNNMLIVADVHLGKVTHFRKAGIPIPVALIGEDLSRLGNLIEQFPVETVLFLGDLFHSQRNSEWEIFTGWMRQFPSVSFELVMGNHDLHAKRFLPKDILVHDQKLEVAPFVLTHEPLAERNSELYNLSGHLHPSVRLRGQNGDELRLPCFYFGAHSGLLPAFGKFTSSAKYKFPQGSKIFGIAEGRVMELA